MLWLLDEPHAGLDAEHRELLDGLLKEVANLGATVILASHEIRTTDVLADRLATMSGGMVLDGVVIHVTDLEQPDPEQTEPEQPDLEQPDLEQPSVA
jgi:ABC-type uncharacterized transport system ATPase subunit